MGVPPQHKSKGYVVTGSDATPGSQSALRQANEGRIVEVLRREGTRTQAELARATGLSAASVSNIVRGLRTAGTVSVKNKIGRASCRERVKSSADAGKAATRAVTRRRAP